VTSAKFSPREAPALSPTDFASAVSALTSAFGDPTRRDIYLFVYEQPDGVTATEVGTRFELHANVARHHLDKLVAGGHLEVTIGRIPGSSGAGRPSKRYRSRAEAVLVELPVRHDELIITLLGRALARLPEAEATALAEEVGVEYGQTLAAAMGQVGDAQRSFRAALHSVADALSAHGFAAHAEETPGGLRIVSDHCPFGDVALEHPVICAVDRGMVRGMLGALYGEAAAETEASRAGGDPTCITSVG
jgi:predicted ArsR family transcriptional regulator